jgi:hypothetical protein
MSSTYSLFGKKVSQSFERIVQNANGDLLDGDGNVIFLNSIANLQNQISSISQSAIVSFTWSGTPYTIPYWNSADSLVSTTIITDGNNVLLNGQLNLNLNKIINLGTASSGYEAVNYNLLNNATASLGARIDIINQELNLDTVTFSNYANLSGATFSGNVDATFTGTWSGNTINDNQLTSLYLKSDGSRSLSGTWSVGSFGIDLNENNIINVATGSNPLDAVNYGQMVAAISTATSSHDPLSQVLSVGNTTGTFSIDMNSNNIINVATGSNPLDAINYGQFYNKTHNTNILNVRKNPNTGEFSSIKSAVDSITTNSITNQFLVNVAPGLYVEDTITLKPYVRLKGSGILQTIININSPVKTAVIGCGSSEICELVITGANNVSGNGIYYDGTGSSATFSTFFINDVAFGNNYNQIVMSASLPTTLLSVNNCIFGGLGVTFSKGFVISSTGGNSAEVSITDIKCQEITGPFVSKFLEISGSNTLVNFNNSQILGGNSTDCFVAFDGARLQINSCLIQDFVNAIRTPNIGVGPIIEIRDIIFNNNTNELLFQHPQTGGNMFGYSDYLKTTIPESAPFFILNKDEKVISVEKKGGDFTSIAAAVAAITDSSFTNRYIIKIGAGTFIEPAIVLDDTKQYISIVGSAIQSTVVIPDTPYHHIFQIGIYNEISFLDCQGSGVGYAGIAILDSGNFSQAHKITFNNCDIGILITSETQDTFFYGEYIDYNGQYSYGTYIQSTNGFAAYANLENYYNFPTSVTASTIGNFVSGTSSECHILASGQSGINSGTAFVIQDGAYVDMRSILIEKWNVGISVPNVGAGPNISAESINIIDIINSDMDIEHPDTTGAYQGTATTDKVIINSVNFNTVIQDLTDGSLDISSDLNIRYSNTILTNISDAITETLTCGVMEGGNMTDGNGLTISVSAGFGYIESISDNSILLRYDWDDSQILLPDNSVNYIYFNNNGSLTASPFVPDSVTNILLGRIISSSASVEIVDSSPLLADHNSNRDNKASRFGFGAIYSSGSSVVQNATYSLHIDIGSGHYFFTENEFLPSGGSNINFISYYQNGIGGWVRTATNSVDSANFDNGLGTLQGLSASYYAKHSMYVVGDGLNEKYMLVYAQNQYNSLLSAQQANIPNPPNYFIEGITPIAAIIVQQGTSSIIQIRDIRPTLSFRSEGVNAPALHSSLLGLLNDDHPQYLRTDGARTLSASLDMGGFDILNPGLVDGVDVASHSSRHLPNGSDPLTTGVPSTIGIVNSEGIQNALARQDHIHAHGNQPGGSLHDVVTQTVNGFMPSSDKIRLDNFSINGITSTTQSFTTSNDSNVTLNTNSSGLTHSFNLGWNGLLSLNRGGLSNSTFTASQILIVDSLNSSVISSGYKFNDAGISTSDVWSAARILNNHDYTGLGTINTITKWLGSTTFGIANITDNGTVSILVNTYISGNLSIVGTMSVGATISSNGINNNFNKIINVSTASNNLDAVNFGQIVASFSSVVPYIGANTDLNLGKFNIRTTGNATFSYGSFTGTLNVSSTGSFGATLFTNGINNNTNKIINLATGSNPLDAVNYNQLNIATQSLQSQISSINTYSGTGISNNLVKWVGATAFSNSNIIDNGTVSISVNVYYAKNVDIAGTASIGSILSVEGINNNTNKITNVASGTNGLDAVNFGQVVASFSSVVPYIGATTDLNLGQFNIKSLGNATFSYGSFINTVNITGTASVGATLSVNGVNLNLFKIINVASGSNNLDAVNYGQLNSATQSLQSQITSINPYSGSGSINKLVKWVGATAFGNSNISDIGTISIAVNTYISGNIDVSGTASIGSMLSVEGINNNTNKIVNVSNGTNGLDAVNFGQIVASFSAVIPYNGAIDDLNLGQFNIKSTGNATFSYLSLTSTLSVSGTASIGATLSTIGINNNLNKIINIASGSNNLDAVNYGQLNSATQSLQSQISSINTYSGIGTQNYLTKWTGATAFGTASIVESSGSMSVYETINLQNTNIIGSFSYIDNNQAIGKILTVDNYGNATWQYPASAAINQYFFYAASSSTIPVYHEASIAPSINSLQTLTFSAITNNQILTSFVTDLGVPNSTSIPAGIYNFEINAQQTAGGTVVQLFFELFKRDISGNEILLITSTNSSALTSVKVNYSINASSAISLTMSATDRLVTKVISNLTGGGAPNVVLGVEDQTVASLTTPSTTISTQNLVPYTGANSNLNLGVYSISSGLINVNSNKIINIATGSNNLDAINFGQVVASFSSFVPYIGSTTDLNLGRYNIVSTGNATFSYGSFIGTVNITGTVSIGATLSVNGINNSLNKIINVATGSNNLDVVNFGQVVASFSSVVPYIGAITDFNLGQFNIKSTGNATFSYGSFTGTVNITGTASIGATLSTNGVNNNNNKIINVATGSNNLDVVNFSQMIASFSAFVPYLGSTADLNLGRYNITSTGSATFSYGSFTGTVNITGTASIGATLSSSLGIIAGTNSQFQINNSGDITKIKGVTYSWPTIQATTASYLTSNSTNNLTWNGLPVSAVYHTASIATGVKIWAGTSSTSTGGTASFLLTTDSTLTGGAIFSSIFTVNAIASTTAITATSTPMAAVKSISTDNRQVVVSVVTGVSVPSGGGPSTAFSGSGVVVYLTAVGT